MDYEFDPYYDSDVDEVIEDAELEYPDEDWDDCDDDCLPSASDCDVEYEDSWE